MLINNKVGIVGGCHDTQHNDIWHCNTRHYDNIKTLCIGIATLGIMTLSIVILGIATLDIVPA